MEDKINRFIKMLANRNDQKLNQCFLEIVNELNPILSKDEIIEEDRGIMEFYASKLRYENEKLYRMLSMFCMEKPDDISDTELKELERFSHGKYYTAKSFFDMINKIRSVKSMMRIFYPEKPTFAKTIEELNKGEIHLNNKLWDHIQN